MWPWSLRNARARLSPLELEEAGQSIPQTKDHTEPKNHARGADNFRTDDNAKPDQNSSPAASKKAVAVLKQQIERLRNERSQLQERIQSHKERDTEQRDKIGELQAEVQFLELQLSTAAFRHGRLTREVTNLYKFTLAEEEEEEESWADRDGGAGAAGAKLPSRDPSPDPSAEENIERPSTAGSSDSPAPKLRQSTTGAIAKPSLKSRQSVVSFASEPPAVANKRAPLRKLSTNVPTSSAQPKPKATKGKGKGRPRKTAPALSEGEDIQVVHTRKNKASLDANNRRLTRAEGQIQGITPGDDVFAKKPCM